MRLLLPTRSTNCLLSVGALATFIAVLCAGDGMQAVAAEQVPRVEKSQYGTMPGGEKVFLFTLTNPAGIEAKAMTLGATLTTVKAPDRDGKTEIITLHKDSFEGYLQGHPLFGSVVGRFANRIANARFAIDGVAYVLVANAGKHHIHGGGRKGFQWQVWKGEAIRGEGFAGVKLTLVSPDGEAGYPGTVRVAVTYKLTDENELVMDYTATTDKPTHVNLTNHAYWNLGGADDGDVPSHVLTINAERYLPTDPKLIPTGELRAVHNTPLDFTTPTKIGARVQQLDPPRYDHCYVLNKRRDQELSLAARVVDPGSGRVMEVHTTQPGVQLYSGNPGGFCLETQHFPNAPNEPKFRSTLLRPGETFHEVTIHRFSTAP